MKSNMFCALCPEVRVYMDSMGTVRNWVNGLRHQHAFKPNGTPYVCQCGVHVFDDADDYKTRNHPTGTLHTCGDTTKSKETIKMAKLLTKVVRNENKKTTTTQDMKIGQIAEVAQYGSDKPLLLRAFNGFVNLRNPSQTWEKDFDATADILPDGSTVTLTTATGITTEVEGIVLSHLKDGNLINAIKAVREATYMGLKESKEYVENFRSKAWEDGTLAKTERTRYPGAYKGPKYDDIPF